MPYKIRPARPSDAKDVAPLIYSSGPRAFEFIFSIGEPKSCIDYLEDAFKGKKGLFSHQHHYVMEDNGNVLAVMASFTQGSMAKTQLATGLHIFKFMGLIKGFRSIVRGLIFEKKLVRAPLKGCYYIAHVGVSQEFRSMGIGEKMVAFIQDKAREKGVKKLALDVSVINLRAQRLYERLNFKVIEERSSYRSELDCHRYMEAPVL